MYWGKIYSLRDSPLYYYCSSTAHTDLMALYDCPKTIPKKNRLRTEYFAERLKRAQKLFMKI